MSKKPYREKVLLWCRISGDLIPATLPFSELTRAPVGPRARFTENIRMIRIYSAGFSAIIAVALIFVGLYFPLTIIEAMVGALFMGLPVGLCLGWLLGPLFASKPIWLMLRDWDDYTKPLDDRQPVIVGIEHTLTRGIPHELYEKQVAGALAQFAEARAGNSNGNGSTALPATGAFGLMSNAGTDDGYIPKVDRAAFLYEILQGRTPAQWLRGVPQKTLQHLQIASMGGLAVVIIIAVVLVIALQSE
jgi:hypothetical protein